jgi:hypothetical protein
MKRAAIAVKRGAPAIGNEPQDRSAPNGIPLNDRAGVEAGRARDPQNIVRRERNDLVMAASAALITLVGKWRFAIHLKTITMRDRTGIVNRRER